MFEILHDLYINAKPAQVYQHISSPTGLNKWWTNDAEGVAAEGETFRFYFSDEHDWRGKVTKCQSGDYIQWEITKSNQDWDGTLVGFELFPKNDGTEVRFSHKNWKNKDENFRTSNYRWAIYLRILKRYLENAEFVSYAHRN